MKLLIMFTILIVFSACQLNKSKTSPQETKNKLSFAEFKKVIHPRSGIKPLANGKESLILMNLPGDNYSKIYLLNHDTKKFTLQFDAGRNIPGFERDYTQKNYYVLLDDHGDENYQIYSYDPSQKTIKKVFGHKGFKAYIVDFSRDGKRLYLSSNHQNKKQYRIYKLDLTTGKLEQLTDGSVSFYSGLVNMDESHAVFSRILGNNEKHIYLMDLKTKKMKKILHKKATKYIPKFFHPTKNELYFTTDHNRDRIACAKISLSNPQKIRWVKSGKNKDISCSYRELDKISFFVETFDGRTKIRVFEDVFKKEIHTPFPPKSIIGQFTIVPKSKKAIVTISRSNSPNEYYIFDLNKGKKAKLQQISQLNRSSIPKQDFAMSYDLYYKSYDGLKIHGIIYAQEAWIKNNQKYPVILWPHGGPDSHVRHYFHPFFQYWALNGFIVFAPNFRGSTGYGKKFETLNDRDWGGRHIKDLIYGKKALAKLPYVDPNRIFIVGASFGGFSTLSAITQYPDEFQGAVAIVALANLFTFMKSIPQDPAWQHEFLTEIGHPVKDKKFYHERSPYFHADKIKIPLTIYQAENDIRTVKAEMDQFVEQLKKYNIPVQYMVLEKEGHSLSRTESWETVLAGTVSFLNQIGSKK